MKKLKTLAFLVTVAGLHHTNLFSNTDSSPKSINRDEDVDGYVFFNENGKYGFIDNTGKTVIPPKFLGAHNFHDGLALVEDDNKMWGYIDKTGYFVIAAKYAYSDDFYEGVAFVKTIQAGKKSFFLLNKAGKTVPIPEFEYYGNFHQGLCNVKTKDNKWGYIDKTGNYFIQPIYSNAGEFHEGLANVDVDRLSGFIDTTRKMVIEPQFITVGFMNFSGGLTSVRLKQARDNGLYQIGFINKKGELQDTKWLKKMDDTTTHPIYALYNPCEGLALLVTNFHDKLWAIIDVQGNIVMNFKHLDLLSDFQNGMAAFQEIAEFSKGKWGFINKQGEVAIKPQFKITGGFMKNGLAFFTLVIDKKEYAGYVNKNGEVVKKWFMYDVNE